MEEFARKNPWLGLESYKEGDILYGRDNDIRDLSQCVLNDIDTLLYGKSGIGKSSILNAGILPAARRSGYLPVLIRLSHKEKHSYLSQINQAILNALLVADGINEVQSLIREVIPCRNAETESFYEYFHRHTFHNANGDRLKLLIIFDQFEEIFTLQDDVQKKKNFFTHLADLLNDIMPDELQQKVEISSDTQEEIIVGGESDFENIFDDLNLGIENSLPEYVTDNDVHFVFTIREDFLSEFEYYSAAIPSLKQNRYGLRPINEEQAAQIILRPVPELIDESVAKLIIEKITEKKDFKIDGVPEIEVDSAVLSLYLNRLYEAKEGKTITKELVEQKGGEIISDFYNDALSDISDSTIEYLEDMLLNGQGRRDNITVYDAINDGNVSEQELDILCNKKKILRQFNYAGDLRIEYVHDILCPVVKYHKEERALSKWHEEEKRKQEERQKQLLLEEENKRREIERKAAEEKERLEKDAIRLRENNKKRAQLFSLILVSVISIGALLIYHNNSLKESYKILVKSQQKLMSLKIRQLIDDDDTYTARRLCLNVMPQSKEDFMDGDNIPVYFKNTIRQLSNNNNAIFSGHAASVLDVSFSSNDSLLASVSDSTIIIRNTKNGSIIRTITCVGGNVLSIAFSPKEDKIVAASDSKTIHVYDIQTGEECYNSLDLHQKGVRFVTFTPDGNKIISASKDKSIGIWDAKKGECLELFKQVHNNEILFLAFSKDYTKMASASADKTIKLWHLNLSENAISLICTLEGHKDWVRSVDFNPNSDDEIISSSDDGTIRVWDTNTRNNVVLHNTNCYVTRALFTSDGSNIVASYRDGTVRVWEVESGIENVQLRGHHNNYVNAVAVTNHAGKFASAGSDRLVRLWDFKSNSYINKYELDSKVLHISTNEDKLVSVVDNNKVQCFNINDLNKGPIWEEKIDNKKFQKSVINTNRNGVVLVGYNTIIIRDLSTGQILNRKDDAHDGWIYAVDLSPDGQYIVTGGRDGNIAIWDWELNLVRLIDKGHNGIITSIEYNHTGNHIVSAAADHMVKIWDVEGDINNPIVLTGHDDDVLYATFSKNDSLVLSSSADKTARLWDIKTKQCKTFAGHGGSVNKAFFGVDEDEIVTVSSDNIMKVWTIDSQQELLSFLGHSGSISSAVYDRKISRIISSSWDHTIRVWDYPSFNSVIDDIFERFHNNPLTDDELQDLYVL